MKQEKPTIHPMFKTVTQMAEISGIGREALRRMMNNGEIDYIPIGNRKLLTDAAMWDWYERNKKSAKKPEGQRAPIKIATRRIG